MSKLYITKTILLYIAIQLLQPSASAQKFSEYEVKAVYLYQFAKFVNWPALSIDSEPNFVIGIHGHNPFSDFADAIYKDKQFKGKPLKIIQVKTPEEAKQCHMIFFSGTDKYSTLKFISKIKTLPVLLVGDQIDDFCHIGGMINFTDKENKYRFEINPDVAKQSDIEISSKLFGVALIISGQEDTF